MPKADKEITRKLKSNTPLDCRHKYIEQNISFQDCIKRVMYHDQMGFIPRKQKCQHRVNIKKSISVIHYII